MKHSHAEARFDAVAPLDAVSVATIQPNDVVHLRARVVEVFDDCVTVDIVGHRSRYRVHPRKAMLTAIERAPADGLPDVIEQLSGPFAGRREPGMMHLRRAPAVIKKG